MSSEAVYGYQHFAPISMQSEGLVLLAFVKDLVTKRRLVVFIRCRLSGGAPSSEGLAIFEVGLLMVI